MSRNNELHWDNADTLGTGANMDDIRTPGVYAVTDPAGFSAGDYHVMVLYGFQREPGNHNVKQIFYKVGTPTIVQIREFNGATWGALGTIGAGGGGSLSDLTVTNRTANNFNVLSTNGIGAGSPATLPFATTTLAGLLTAADKAKLDSLPPGFLGVYTDSAALATARPTGAAGEYAILTNPSGPPTFGVWDPDTSAWVTVGAITVGTTNLSFSRDGTTLTILSDTGADAVLPVATINVGGLTSAGGSGGLAGIMSADDKTRIFNDQVFNVLNYGAKNDNNPASGAVNRTAFEAAIVAAAAVGGGTIYAPRGTYYINYGGSAASR